MFLVELDFHLEEPLLVTDVAGGDPNTEKSLPYLPGSVIRGAFAGRYLADRNADTDDFRRVFLDGGVRFLNAHLLVRGNKGTARRALPCPMSWNQPKDAPKTAPITDFALRPPAEDDKMKEEDREEDKEESKAQTLWKGLREQWYAPVEPNSGKAEVVLAKPRRIITIHTARIDRQRPAQAGAAIFRYDALAQGQALRGALLADSESDLLLLLKLVPSETYLWMGRSRRAGYGKTLVTHVGEPKEAENDWSEVPALEGSSELLRKDTRTQNTAQERLESTTPGGLPFTITFLSDTILRDEVTGAYTTSITRYVGAEPKSTYLGTRIVGGFNRKWNLPLPQAQAIAAGSVFVFAAGAVKAEKQNELRSLSQRGIGERTVEGFGRFAVALSTHPTISIVNEECNEPKEAEADDAGNQAEGNIDGPNKAAIGDADKEAILSINRRLWLQEAASRKISFLAQVQFSRPPTNAQLSRLRTVVLRSTSANEGFEELLSFLKGLKSTGRRQLTDASITYPKPSAANNVTGAPLLTWIQGIAETPGKVWTHLGMEAVRAPRLGTAVYEPQPRDTISQAAELIGAVLQKMAKENAAHGDAEMENTND